MEIKVIFNFGNEEDNQELTKESISAEMDRDIDNFSKYMESIADLKAAGPLHPMEKMLLKTYLIWKYKVGT